MKGIHIHTQREKYTHYTHHKCTHKHTHIHTHYIHTNNSVCYFNIWQAGDNRHYQTKLVNYTVCILP